MDDSFFPPTRLPIVRLHHQGTLTWLLALHTVLMSHSGEGETCSLDATEKWERYGSDSQPGKEITFRAGFNA